MPTSQPICLSDILTQKVDGKTLLIEVPRLQRDYSWDESNVREMWEDLIEHVDYDSDEEMAPHFFGTLVLCHNSQGRFSLIDGQQRLTTFFLFLSEIKRRMAGLRRAPQVLSVVQNCLFEYGKKDKSQIRLILQPGLDRDFFRLVTSDTFSEQLITKEYLEERLRKKNSSVHLERNKLVIAFKTVQEMLEKEIKSAVEKGYDEADILHALADRFLSGSTFLFLVTQSEVHAYQLFESLNDRGVDLSQADLFKNRICSYLVSDEEVSEFGDKWSDMKERMSSEPQSMVSFLRSYFIAQYHAVRKSELLDEYVKVLESKNKGKKAVLKRAKALIEELGGASNHYCALLEPHKSALSERVKCNLEILNKMGARSCRHAILAAMHHEYPELQALTDAIVALQIRSAVVGDNPNKYEKAHIDVAGKIRNTPSISLNKLLEIYSALLPQERTVREKFSLCNSIAIPAWRVMLEKINDKLGDRKELRVDNSKCVEVEHVLPQNPRKSDLVAWGLQSASDAKKICNLPGNLTLLYKPYNAKSSNKPFVEKKNQLKDSALVALNGYFSDFDVWQLEQINQRSIVLMDVLLSIWPRAMACPND